MYASFFDELEKIADEVAPPPDQPHYSWLKTIGAGLGAGALGAGAFALSRPGMRRQMLYDLKHLGAKGGGHAVERAKALPQQAIDEAKQVADFLRSKGIDPKTARIGISGTGGTGKTTLARGLSEHLGMNPLMMDDVGKSISGRDLTSYVRKNPIAPGTVAEQTHLLHQVDPDKFDAIIRVHKPMEQVKQQLLDRGRGAQQLDLYDYDRLHKTIETAFKGTAGEVHDVLPHVQIKFRPEGGFQGQQILSDMARAKGVDPTGIKRRSELAYAAAHGKKSVTPGILPYVRMGNVGAGVGITAGAGLGGGMLAHHLQKPSQPQPAQPAPMG